MSILTEIAALAKAGYSVQDVKDILNMDKGEPEKVEPEKVEPEKAEPEKAEPEKVEPEKVEPEKEEIDYKKLYEESQKTLKEIQKKNTKLEQPTGGTQSAMDRLKDSYRKLL